MFMTICLDLIHVYESDAVKSVEIPQYIHSISLSDLNVSLITLPQIKIHTLSDPIFHENKQHKQIQTQTSLIVLIK